MNVLEVKKGKFTRGFELGTRKDGFHPDAAIGQPSQMAILRHRELTY